MRIIITALFVGVAGIASAQTPPPQAPVALKDEMRMPWRRDNPDYLRYWEEAGPFKCDLFTDCAEIPDDDGAEQHAPDSKVDWKPYKTYNDVAGFDALTGDKDRGSGFALAVIQRAVAGKAVLSIGSDDGLRAWVNGKLVLERDGHRSLTFDEDQVEVDLHAGANTLLVKTAAAGQIAARVLETGSVLARRQEIGPSLIEMQPDDVTVRTDFNHAHRDAAPVDVELVKPGGEVAFQAQGARGDLVIVHAKGLPAGPYEIRISTTTSTGLRYSTNAAWYKGDSLAKARELVAEAAKADGATPAGATLKMLANMVEDRLGTKVSEAKGNPWPKIHSPLMEFAELELERAGKTGRIHASGFVRLAWRDEVDGSTQFARVYLPMGYDASRKFPLVVQLHGFNPPNPVYWKWWSASARHIGLDTEFAGHEQVIYMEVHGRGNTQYLGMGDADVMRAIAEAKRLLAIDADRVYLTGDSMGGWGTWNVGTRHPDVFAAIAPVFGGFDYHSTMSEEQLAKLSPVERFVNERDSTWAQADGLLNVPILVQHGDADTTVNVDFSRWGVRLLQRWGYDVRYHEYPGRIHEALQFNNGQMSIPWLLEHRREAHPRHVRLRSAELRHACAYWLTLEQAATPLDFMKADAEVVDSNLIRLDTDNVLALTLTPDSPLVDASKPLRVVWNGVVHEGRLVDGALHLMSADYLPGKLAKSAQLPGGLNDFAVTPYAVVIGTAAKEPATRATIERKARDWIDGWTDWQKVVPRVFRDTEITDADIAKYSLLLVGGPAENRVTAKLAAGIPLRLRSDEIVIDGRAFAARDAAVQLVYPNPRNPARYVRIAAGNSPAGLRRLDLDPQHTNYWDYTIDDGRIPARGEQVPALRTAVASGMFDEHWRFRADAGVPGDAAIRARGRTLGIPDPSLVVDPQKLDEYVGMYQVVQGPAVQIGRDGARFFASAQGRESPLIAESDTSFFAETFNVHITFVRDAAGKVSGFTGYGVSNGDVEAKRD